MRSVDSVNEDQKQVLVQKVRAHYGDRLAGRTLAIWGLAFKPRTDDIREAPALALIDKLLAAKAKVQAFDPEAMANVKRVLGEKITFAPSLYEAVKGADALVLATEWNEFRTPDWDRVKKLMRSPVVFDGRNIYRAEYLRELGFSYYGIGRQ